MDIQIASDKIKLKPFSLGWLNYCGFAGGLIMIGLIQAYFYLKNIGTDMEASFFNEFLLFIPIVILSCFIQYKRLEYKTFKLNCSLESFKENTRKLLIENKWKIDYDNKNYIQATYNNGLGILNMDMLTIKYKKDEIQWNVIRHPHNHNSFLALLTLNSKGRKMISMIKSKHDKMKR